MTANTAPHAKRTEGRSPGRQRELFRLLPRAYDDSPGEVIVECACLARTLARLIFAAEENRCDFDDEMRGGLDVMLRAIATALDDAAKIMEGQGLGYEPREECARLARALLADHDRLMAALADSGLDERRETACSKEGREGYQWLLREVIRAESADFGDYHARMTDAGL